MKCECSVQDCGVCSVDGHKGQVHDCETCGDPICDECYYCVHDFGRCKGRT